MERVNSMDCAHWRELLAADVFGELDADQTLALRAHREGCADCDAIAREFASTVAALALAEPDAHDAVPVVPVELTERVLAGFRAPSRRRGPRRVVLLTAAAAAVAAVVVVTSVLVRAGGGSPGHAVTDALTGAPGVTSTAVLTDRSWGTSLRFTETGQAGTGEFTVWMGAKDGTWWNAGTYHAVDGRRVVATMSCAVPPSDIVGLRVIASNGDTVLTYGTGSSYSSVGPTHA